jgi:YbbR domain-containing protein
MKLKLSHNWIAKILSLLLAIAIWFLIKQNLNTGGGFKEKPPRAIPIRE